MRASRRATAVVAPAAFLLGLGQAATTAADASTRIQTLPCVAADGVKATVPIIGSGFTPGGLVKLSYLHQKLATPVVATTVRADGAGNVVAVTAPAPFAGSGTVQQDFGLSAEDESDPTTIVQTRFRQVRFGISVSPSDGPPDSRVTYTVRGFPLNHSVYAHFRLRGRTLRTVKIGIATPDCGIASRRMRLIPAAISAGTWQLYFDDVKSYSPKSTPQFHASINVHRST